MSTRAFVKDSAWLNGVSVYMARDAGEGEVAVPTANSDGIQWEIIGERSEPKAFLTLPDDMGRALLDALLEHYRGSGVSRQLRADYEHERKRVDRLIGHLIGETGVRRDQL